MSEIPDYPKPSLIRLYEAKPPSVKAVLFDGSDASIAAIDVMLRDIGASLMRNVSTGACHLANDGTVRSAPIPCDSYVVVTYGPNTFPSAHCWPRSRLEQAYRPAL